MFGDYTLSYRLSTSCDSNMLQHRTGVAWISTHDAMMFFFWGRQMKISNSKKSFHYPLP